MRPPDPIDLPQPPALTFPCGCGQELHLWLTIDGRRGLRAQHGENPEHSIDLTPDDLPDDAIVVRQERIYHGVAARDDPWVVEIRGWWIKAVHEREGDSVADQFTSVVRLGKMTFDHLAEVFNA